MITRTHQTNTKPPPSAVRLVRLNGQPVNQAFSGGFCIGRDDSCEVKLESGMASRRHAEVVCVQDQWHLRDLGSTNGTLLDGKPVKEAVLTGKHVVKLGVDGPELELRIDPAPPAAPGTSATTRAVGAPRTRPSDSSTPVSDANPSLTGYIQRYFTDDGNDAGEHTRMIRQAYQRVDSAHRQRYQRLAIGAAVAIVLAIAWIGVQQWRMGRLEERAQDAFATLKELEVQTARLQAFAEERGDATLVEQLEDLKSLRERARLQYEGYVEELGLRRRLTEEERVIYRVARIFNESEFRMPAAFVRAVRQTIDEYWLSPAGRSRLAEAVARAEEAGYTEHIVRSMMRQGLPPEFFYLALQESNFDPGAIGPRTRWGIAKGMWQFIPETARAYGLVTGPREDQRALDPQDDRHDPLAATDAASRYLLEIYGQLAQASGLLAMASYNWGERRVVSKLEELLEGIPDDPQARSYWRFLTEYSDRMPSETKDYVLKIFAAAVIGQNPRLFGFDFDNPLQPYIEAESVATES